MTAFLIGGYGVDMGGSATGIAWGRSADDGRFSYEGVLAELASPSWLTVDGDRVLAALEGTGELAELRAVDGWLSVQQMVDAGGRAPCHIAVSGSAVVVACYVDGRVVVHEPIGQTPRVLAGAGSGPRDEQDGPHAHHVLTIRGGGVLTLDLGSDEVHVHDAAMHRTATIALPGGTGPRDLLELADGRVLVLGELSGEVLSLVPSGSSFEIGHRERLLGVERGDHAAGLALVRGRFVVTGLRGSDRLSVLEVTDAGLRAVASVPTQGEWPRHLVADGSFVHVANQHSSTVTTFLIGGDGTPEHVHEPVAVPSPTCLAAVGSGVNL